MLLNARQRGGNMAFIQCPGCSNVFDAAALGSVVCEKCERCFVCGAMGNGLRPSCRHRLTPEILVELEESLRVPDDRVEFQKRFPALGYSWKGGLVLAIIQIPLFMLLLASVLVVSVIMCVFALTHRLLAKGWFPWMIKRGDWPLDRSKEV
jgi:hypothetical protein